MNRGEEVKWGWRGRLVQTCWRSGWPECGERLSQHTPLTPTGFPSVLRDRWEEPGLQSPRGEACRPDSRKNPRSQVWTSLVSRGPLEQIAGPWGGRSPTPPWPGLHPRPWLWGPPGAWPLGSLTLSVLPNPDHLWVEAWGRGAGRGGGRAASTGLFYLLDFIDVLVNFITMYFFLLFCFLHVDVFVL